MSMDGRFIDALAKELNRELADARINKIYQLSRADFLFNIRALGKNSGLYLSLSPQAARLHLTDADFDRPAAPSGFCMLLRKHLESGTIRRVECLNNDRIIRLSIENNNEFGERVLVGVVVELMGKHANMAVVEQDGTIIDAYKRVSPFEERDRTFLRGFKYEIPEDGKIDPLDLGRVAAFFESRSDLDAAAVVAAIRGFSPLSAEYLLKRAFNRPVILLDVYGEFLAMPADPVSTIVSGKRRFYWFDLFDEPEKRHFETLSALIDDFYLESGRQDRTIQAAKRVFQLVRRESDRAKSKREKLEAELASARDAGRHRVAADLIIQHSPDLKKGDDRLEAVSYDDGSTMTIPLDRLLEPMENAEAYFRKYKKAKQAVAHIESQLDLTDMEIRYFDLLSTQLETATLADLVEIAEELKANGYLREKPAKTKQPATPAYETFRSPDGIEIVVGKNNIQNDYVTNRLAKPAEWWFHVKDIPGGHVLVRAPGPLSEATIRCAANLAAYHSQARHSSSVPVDYTLVRNVRKIPGMLGSFVTITGQRTIYIDPDGAAVESCRIGKKR
ncbi:MAG: NFACT family protein [Candidatus Izemoplasmatales bacterium]